MIRNLLASLRRAPGAHIGVLVALTVAAAMMTTTTQFAGTATQLDTAGHRLAAAEAVVTGDQHVRYTTGSGEDRETTALPLPTYRRVPAELAARIAGIDGVVAAVADVSVSVALGGDGDEQATAHGWSSAQLAPFALIEGTQPRASGEIVLGDDLAARLGVAVGDPLSLTGTAEAPFTVVGIVAAPAGDPSGATAAFLTDAEARARYAHPGEADFVAAVATPGRGQDVRDAVREAAAGYTVRTGDNRALAEDVGLAKQREDLGAIAAGAGIPIAMVAMFVVAGAIGLSIAGRRRTFALLRSVGATPGQIRRQVSAELAMLGVAAGVAGYAVGTLMTMVAIRGMVDHGLVPEGTSAWNAPWVLFTTCGAGLVVAQLSGFVAARRASRTDPLVALREADVDRRRPSLVRLVLGLAALGGGITLTAVMANETSSPVNQINLALGQLLALITAVALLSPVLVSLAELLVRKPMQLLGGAGGRLAAADIRRRPARVASAVVAVALSISFLGTVYLVNANVIHAGREQSGERLVAGSVVAAPGGLAPDALDAVAGTAGAGTTIGMYPTTVFLPVDGGYSAPAVALTSGRIPDVLDLGVHEGSLDAIGPDQIALSRLAAGNKDVGDTVEVHLADGTPFTATVVALYDRGLGFGDAVISPDAAGGGHLGTETMAQVFTAGALRDADVDTLASRYPGLDAASASAANAEAERLDEQNAYLNNLIVILMAGLAAVTLVNTLVTATVERRSALALLDRVGATRQQLMGMALWQTAAVAGIGLLLGVAAGGTALLGVTKALTGSWSPHLPVAPIVGFVLAALTLTTAAILTPTAAILRRLDRG